ncbi:uncharacterized protein LOC133195204 [Saccostrea echinata]|uniref:uncharacterized protein LOC133195204 n=1 Tax=Saccostrea echinata TaxID=191078 RepID=UPI002A80DF67|nr:uncharacterized protein LOC133195204 [Saccostrea echinata]
MSTNSENTTSPVLTTGEKEGGSVEMDNSSMLSMLKDMQNSIVSLTSSVSSLQQRGKKRKAETESNQPGPSKAKDLSDISSDEEDVAKDGFSDLIDDQDVEEEFDNDSMLDELAECFGSEEKCGEPIHEKLAKVTNEGVRATLNGEKIKEVSKKYNRPKNVQNLVTPKINEEIRVHLGRKIRNQDMRFQRTQALVAKAMVPQLQQINMLLNSKQKGNTPSVKDLTVLAMDGLKLMTYVYCDLSNRRRELIIQPEKNEEFRVLCSREHQVTDKLFGDELGKKVEEIAKANKVGSKISGHNKQEKRNFQSRKPYQQGQKSFSYSPNYRTQSFLGQRTTQNYKKKTFNKQSKK